MLLGCNDSSTDDLAGGQESVLAQTNLFPQPPSIWLGESSPYYTAGYAGDVMPFYDNGKFNLFFLHDAKSKTGGQGYHDIHNFQTADFANYSYKGRRISYGTVSDPDFAVGTGSVIKSGSTYYFYYTGNNANSGYLENNPRESILLAKSTDLMVWTKDKTFKMTAPSGYYNYEFRDPQVFFNADEGKYWMLVSAQTADRKAVILKFTATDLSKNQWSAEAPLYTTSPEDNYIMMECPDIFRMGNYWYLIFSENWSTSTGTHYRYAATLNGVWTKPQNDRIDGSYFYGGKTVSNGKDRFIVGWSARRDPENNSSDKQWAGNIVTHKLVQNSNGTLGVTSPQDYSSIFTTAATLQNTTNTGSVNNSNDSYSLGTTSATYFGNLANAEKITFKYKPGSGKSGLVFSKDPASASEMRIVFNVAGQKLEAYRVNNGAEELVNTFPAGLNSGETYNISMIISNNVCAMYINDNVAFTNRIYNIAGNRWGFFNEQGTSTISNLQLKTAAK